MSLGMPEIVLGLDFGLRRIGLAVGDSITRTARPLPALTLAQPGELDIAAWRHLESELRSCAANRLVVGCPYNVDGTEHEMTRRAREFAAHLATRFALPVELVDERYSSLEAEANLRERRSAGQRGRIDRAAIDSAAAAVILERWFN